MDNLNKTLAKNLKSIRTEKNLSLDRLSKLTDVSKSMLGQIERGETNPTISTVWKIANGLKVSFSSLIDETKSDTILIKQENQTPIAADEGKYIAYSLFPYSSSKQFEIYKIDMDEGCQLSSEPHPSGSYEYITVFSGKLMILASGEKYSLSKGDALKFKADCNHSYHNVSDETVSLSMVIHYYG
ncbi:MAG: XRE family transcriptional regulator [Acidaminobacteraceae bacterium]